MGGKHRDEGITWFKYIYPLTQRTDWPKEYKPVSKLWKQKENSSSRWNHDLSSQYGDHVWMSECAYIV